MQLLSLSFVILWAAAFALYYLAPRRAQWYILLVASLLFYAVGLRGFPLHLLLIGLITYGGGLYLKDNLEREKAAVSKCVDRESKKALKAAFGQRRKRVQVLCFVCDLGLLVFYKYAVIVSPFLEKIAGSDVGFLGKVIMPLGISFYTLTAIGYLTDVGRENCEAETNFLKILLFLAYFPSVTQGPFNRYKPMKEQFESGHDFQYDRMLRGIQRFVWGAFKKLVIADRIGIFVDRVYGVEASSVPGSIFVCATVFYMLQLYADFSGYIDMAMGVSETFDIAMPENFKRPYFAGSVAEFWRRWHITLGTWFKDYVMFSFVMSGVGRKIGKACKKRWNTPGRQIVPIMGTMLVWFFTGLWHGRTLSYMLWGIYYGVIMSVSLLLEQRYPLWKERFRIRDGGLWSFVCMVRTWLIVFIADVLIRSESLTQAGAIYESFLIRLQPMRLVSHEITSYGLSKYDFMLLIAVLAVWLAVSVLEERGRDVRAYLAAKPTLVRWGCYYGVVLTLLLTGIYGGGYDTATFMYQSF